MFKEVQCMAICPRPAVAIHVVDRRRRTKVEDVEGLLD